MAGAAAATISQIRDATNNIDHDASSQVVYLRRGNKLPPTKKHTAALEGNNLHVAPRSDDDENNEVVPVSTPAAVTKYYTPSGWRATTGPGAGGEETIVPPVPAPITPRKRWAKYLPPSEETNVATGHTFLENGNQLPHSMNAAAVERYNPHKRRQNIDVFLSSPLKGSDIGPLQGPPKGVSGGIHKAVVGNFSLPDDDEASQVKPSGGRPPVPTHKKRWVYIPADDDYSPQRIRPRPRYEDEDPFIHRRPHHYPYFRPLPDYNDDAIPPLIDNYDAGNDGGEEGLQGLYNEDNDLRTIYSAVDPYRETYRPNSRPPRPPPPPPPPLVEEGDETASEENPDGFSEEEEQKEEE